MLAAKAKHPGQEVVPVTVLPDSYGCSEGSQSSDECPVLLAVQHRQVGGDLIGALILGFTFAARYLAKATRAWVLWEGVWTGRATPHEHSWAVIAAWSSYEDCQPVGSRAVADRASRWRSCLPHRAARPG